MIDGEPLPERGLLRKGVIYRVPRSGPPWETDPKVLEIVRRVEQTKLREYLDKRKRAS